jgi:DNA-binding GntR family transcriptional regulator
MVDTARTSAKTNGVKRHTLADELYNRLRVQLMTGKLLPGEKLTLRAVADQFGTSMMPVRDAVRRLTAEGGLQMFPNRTIRVNSPSPEKFSEILKIRSSLEGLATEIACRQISDAAIQKIQVLVTQFENEGQKPRPNPTVLSRINRDLHFGVYRAAKQPLLLDMIESLWVQVAPALSLTMRYTTRGVSQWESFQHHARLAQSLKRRDPVRARQAIVADIRDAGAFILRSGALEMISTTAPSAPNKPKRIRHRL